MTNDCHYHREDCPDCAAAEFKSVACSCGHLSGQHADPLGCFDWEKCLVEGCPCAEFAEVGS